MIARSDVNKYPCPSCGALLKFTPGKDLLKCDYCGHEDEAIQATEEVEEYSYEQYFNVDQSELVQLSNTALEISCDRCGASITFEPPQTSGKCTFCAADIVCQPTIANPTLVPEGIVPFAIGRQEARKHLMNWLRGQWLAPNQLKNLAQPERIKGVYLPFWTYDSYSITDYTGKRGTYYYTTETCTTTNEEGEEEETTREVRHTSWSPTSGRVKRFFDDVLVAATELVNNQRLDALEPWNLDTSLRPYEPSYLAGFEAQCPQMQLKEGFELAKKVMEIEIKQDIKNNIGGDTQEICSFSTAYSAITFKHILLPVWLTSYRYKNQQYQVLINANTGEVQGDHPICFWKVAITIEILVGIITILILLRPGSNIINVLFVFILIELITLFIIKIFWHYLSNFLQLLSDF